MPHLPALSPVRTSNIFSTSFPHGICESLWVSDIVVIVVVVVVFSQFCDHKT